MTPEYFKRIGDLFHAAAKLHPERRDEFLRQACGADEELFEEVQALLAANAGMPERSFLETPAIEVAARLAAQHVAAKPLGGHPDPVIGRTFGSYKVKSLLGAGGMGAVYRAWDSRLKRDVAIKALPAEFSRDADRVARFQREAEIVASLNHPHISAIYDVASFDEFRFLVLELVEGETLAERIARGPLPIEEALRIGVQIAEALEAAHEIGIIHRDLKPVNIKIKPDGNVKVLDFGLAKATEKADAASTAPTAASTASGMILGTAAYMSPEQAKGMTAGAQADIWAFGCVLFEMLTGHAAFARETLAETIANVIGGKPDLDSLPDETPALVRRLLRRCLEKETRDRLRHVGDARADLLEARNTAPETFARPRPERPGSAKLLRIAGAAAVVLMAGLAGWFFAQRSGSRSYPDPVRLSLSFFERPSIQPMGIRHLSISGDGSRLAYTSQSQLWIRRMDQKEASALGVSGWNPFFSPDGQWVAFFRQTELVKAPVDGGAPIVITQTTERSGGGDWRADGTIVFATTGGLYQVSANGGHPQLLAKPDRQKREKLYAFPEFLPDGQSILFTIAGEDPANLRQVALLDLKTLKIKHVLPSGSSARYVPTGHIVFASGPRLKAIAFDLDRQETTGLAIDFPDIEIGIAPDNGAADFAVSASGVLVFLSTPTLEEPRTLMWVDRQGKQELLPVEARPYSYARVSPEGNRVALDVRGGTDRDIWILDLKRLTQVRLTDGPTEDMLPLWSPDGSRVFFASDRQGNFDIYSQAADGASGARLEFASPGFQEPESFVPDGTRLIVYENFKDTGVLNMTHPDHIERLLYSEFDDRLGQVSPDEKWIVYESNESGNKFEIFLRPFPNVSDRREKISIDGGRFPLWGRKNSDELYYVNLDGDMMAASVKLSPELKLGGVTKLFTWQKPPAGVSGRLYDISPIDGRFLMTKPATDSSPGPTYVSVILNWLERLREPARTGRRR
jgi:serine/threonine-protein kinase